MNLEQDHGPSRARHLAPIIAAIVILIIIAWVLINNNGSDEQGTADSSLQVIQTLQGAVKSLADVDQLAENINENHLVPGWRMMESYVINRQESIYQSPDAPDPFTENLALLTGFVEKNQAIARTLASLPEGSVSPALSAEIVSFADYAQRLADRLAALEHSVETGDPLPPVISRPKDFEKQIQAEIVSLQAG